jgi:hypothetical protein
LFRTKGYVPTCYSPVCRSPCGALDLHVLSLPPAFALSQDQTLKLDEIDLGKSQRFDEVPPLNIREACAPKTVKGVDLKRVPPKFLIRPPFEQDFSRRQAARKDSAVHVSLSSDLPFKQPGTDESPLPGKNRRAVEAGIRQGRMPFPPRSRVELQRRAIAPMCVSAPKS